ncbi:MAG: amidohydrolase [Fimbriimonadaceae bacterium]|nr:amidohydrolase [Fimbriimonadaceae bacterium]QYK55568.1 MAG: amidohydrolase [Fimbriimonadaceae bacterium]
MKTTYGNGRTLDGRPLCFSVENGRFREVANDSGEGFDVDLGGKTIAPGFVDAHCHILPTGLDLQKLHLGGLDSREAVVAAVERRHGSHPDGWLAAVHYDQTRFADARHLTRDEIDAVVPSRPVLLRHSNGHASVANSAALVAAGVREDEPDPAGGTYVRDEGGRLTGVLLERAHERVTAAMPTPTLAEMTSAILEAGHRMAELGIACATDMMTGRWDLEQELLAYNAAAEAGCEVALRLCLQWGTVLGPRGIEAARLRELLAAMDPVRCRAIGLKIFADGAIGSATAAIHGAFLTTGGNGQLIYAPDKLKKMVAQAAEADWSVAVHTIGDRSTDLVMDAVEATPDPSRHRLEHVMMLSDEQIARIVRLGCEATMQPEFLMRFGHAYQKQLGPAVSARLKRARSCLDAGVKLSFSSDRPIVPGDPRDGIACAVRRPEGFDPAENVTLEEAVRAYTVDAARANGDQGLFGEIRDGAVAAFQEWERAPVTA